MRTESETNTIFVQLDNPKLERAIARCAKRLGCNVVRGRTPTALFEATYFIAVVDRNVVGSWGWDFYLSYVKSLEEEVNVEDESLEQELREWLQVPLEESPLILIDQENDYPIPDFTQVFHSEPKDIRRKFEAIEKEFPVPKSVRIHYCKPEDVHAIIETIEMEYRKIERNK